MDPIQLGLKWYKQYKKRGYQWPKMKDDCNAYAKECKSCQKHGYLPRVPAIELHSVIKPWPFKGWTMDLIREIFPHFSKNYAYILIAIYQFTKQVEAIPLKKETQIQVIKFIKQNIVARFRIQESITMDNVMAFIGA